MRMLVGYVLLAPFSGLLMYLTVVAQLALGVWFLNGSPRDDIAPGLALAVAIFAAPIAVIFGAVPGVAWLIKRDLLTLPNLLLAGVLLGNLPIAILTVLALAEQYRKGTLASVGPMHLFGPLGWGAWFGVWGALFFWFVSIRGTELDSRTSNLEP
jgi:hypothetical protein